MILPLPIVQSIVGPISGLLSDRFGSRPPASVGLVLQALGCILLARLGPTSTYIDLLPGLIVLGIGGGLFWAPNTSAAMSAAPAERLGVASATLATFRQTGMVTSFALALAVAAAALPASVAGGIFLGTSGALGGQVMASFSIGMAHALVVSAVIALGASAMTVLAGETRARSA
ncbi:MAG TPA: MFS transporter, partial [Candidatus Limnocylindrales bacterium]